MCKINKTPLHFCRFATKQSFENLVISTSLGYLLFSSQMQKVTKRGLLDVCFCKVHLTSITSFNYLVTSPDAITIWTKPTDFKYHNDDCICIPFLSIKIPQFDFIVRSSCHVWIPHVPIPLGFIYRYKHPNRTRKIINFFRCLLPSFKHIGENRESKAKDHFSSLPLRKNDGLFVAFQQWANVFCCWLVMVSIC